MHVNKRICNAHVHVNVHVHESELQFCACPRVLILLPLAGACLWRCPRRRELGNKVNQPCSTLPPVSPLILAT